MLKEHQECRLLLNSWSESTVVGELSTAIDIPWDAPLPELYNSGQPWCRQPCDDEQAWHMFRRWLQSSIPRCLKKLSRATNVPECHLRRWHDANVWELRALAFDNHVHQLWQGKVEVEIVETAGDYAQRHGRLLAMGTELLQNELKKYLEVSRSTDGIGLLRPEHLSQLASTFVKLERLHHDQSTENVAVAEIDLSRASLEDLKELKRIYAKVGV